MKKCTYDYKTYLRDSLEIDGNTRVTYILHFKDYKFYMRYLKFFLGVHIIDYNRKKLTITVRCRAERYIHLLLDDNIINIEKVVDEPELNEIIKET